MANGNSITLVGNITRDPELRFTPSGAAKASKLDTSGLEERTLDLRGRAESVAAWVTVPGDAIDRDASVKAG